MLIVLVVLVILFMIFKLKVKLTMVNMVVLVASRSGWCHYPPECCGGGEGWKPGLEGGMEERGGKLQKRNYSSLLEEF